MCRACCTAPNSDSCRRAGVFACACCCPQQPILFWTAPWIFNYLPMLDGRFILVSRPSPKAQYVVLLVVFIAALALKGLSWRKQVRPLHNII